MSELFGTVWLCNAVGGVLVASTKRVNKLSDSAKVVSGIRIVVIPQQSHWKTTGTFKPNKSFHDATMNPSASEAIRLPVVVTNLDRVYSDGISQ